MPQTLQELVEGKSWRELRKLYEEIRSGKLLITDPDPPRDYATYMQRLDYTLWYWTSLATLILAVISVYATNIIPGASILRVILGSIVVLFLPGYATIEALYPKEGELSSLERLALSIGLSLAIVPLIGLALNYTPWGIRLNPIIITLTAYTTTILTIAAYRKYQLTRKEIQVQNMLNVYKSVKNIQV